MQEKILSSMAEAFEVFDRIGGRIFGVTFVKVDGSVREMNARQDVRKHLKGGTLAYSPRPKGLLPVYDLHAEGYRMVNVRNLIEIRSDGVRYRRGW